MKNVTPIIFLLTFLIINSNIYIINCQVEHSFDLNCDFDKDNLCLWHNSNITWDHTSDWSISKSTLNITSINKEIVPMPLNNGFIYTNGTNNGLNTALLVSDVISCQLGGAEINYWYYKTQINSRLEICIRQPPGSLNFLHQKCYDGVQAIQANQWVYQKIELPPFSQPFEILIRGYFIQPDDIIAIDKISYEAALCDSTHGQISVITIDKWNEIKHEINSKENNIKPMLVIADSINQKDDTIIEKKENELSNNNTTNNIKTIDNNNFSNVTKVNTENVPNFLNIFHDVSPFLNMLLKSFQQSNNLYTNQLSPLPYTSSILNANIPIKAKASKTLQINELTNIEDEKVLDNEENISKPLMKYEVPIKKNIYVAKINQNNLKKKTYKELPTKNIYPSNFHPHQINIKTTTLLTPTEIIPLINNNEKNTNYNNEKHLLSNNQLKKKTIIRPKKLYEQIEKEKNDKIIGNSMGKEIFERNNNNNNFLINENNVTKVDNKINYLLNKLSEHSINFDDISRQLTPEMINELQMLSNFDDLESLTEGMDFALLTKPEESVIQGSNKNDAGFILDDEYKLFGTKTYINNKDKTKLEYDYDTFFSENSSCSPINCNFNNNNFCEWISLDDDSDIALTFSMYDTNIKKWSFGINSLGNSVTGILDNQNKRKNYIYAGDTNNPNDIFILSTQKEIFFNQPSKILFDFYHAGIHGELKHRILIYTNGLINNYFIGFDNIRLTQLNTHKAADCS
uniref:MAM domain-containing protein n=1 Tax=Strongyloides stercoralis TaxID=6248 RepID=A0AAF5DQ14_STRER